MKPTLAITLGDPAGIGPEIVAKVLADRETYRICNPVVVGDRHAMMMGIEVAGLNPHSGDGGLFGDEEARIIQPAIDAARAEGLDVDGPVPPDTVFGKAAGGQYDIVVALYHDQGHIPVKLIGMKYDDETGQWGSVSGVNVTLGLSFIRTSVDHGTAYGKAGRREGTANPQSLMEAIELAVKMAKARKQ